MRFPPIAIDNRYWIGDNVIAEPICRELALSYCSYMVSAYPEMFKAHPTVMGVRNYDKLPEDTRLVDLGKTYEEVEDKREKLFKKAGLPLSEMPAPRLYLTAAERRCAEMFRSLFTGPCIGVVLNSRFSGKDYKYTKLLVKLLLKQRRNVFLISKAIDERYKRLPYGWYAIEDVDIRELMSKLWSMDIVIGPDTGPVHIAAALGTPTVVISYAEFSSLYTCYKRCTVLTGDASKFSKSGGISSVPAARVLQAIDASLSNYYVPELKKSLSVEKHLFVRFRGIGDVLLSLPAIATLRSQRPKLALTYLTSNSCKKMLEGTDILDEVIGRRYNHDTSGYPTLPEGVEYDNYDFIYNMINRVDFEPETDHTKRTDMFAKLVGVRKIDYNTDWHLHVKQEWRDKARQLFFDNRIAQDDKVLVLQTDSDGLIRRWPEVRQRKFADLAIRDNFRVVLVGNKQAKEFADSVVNLTGMLSIEEFIGILAECSIFVGPDSSGIHIMGAIGEKPAIGLFGSVAPELRIAHYDNVYPIVGKGGCVPCHDRMPKGHKCLACEKSPYCLWSISPRKVMGKVNELVVGVV